MNTPEITIGSKWREKDDKSAVVIVIHISPSAILVTGEQFADGWTWYSKAQFADTFEPHVWTLDEAMREAGYVLGPGQKWHRDDFKEEDLPPMTDGGLPWRPATLNEDRREGDEVLWDDKWVEYSALVAELSAKIGRNFVDSTCRSKSERTRTRRPLPAVEEWIPLGPEDVPPGSVLRFAGERYWQAVVGTAPDGIYRICRDVIKHLTWHEAMTHYDILRPAQTEWQPCKKLKA